jgi:hypothetical protein
MSNWGDSYHAILNQWGPDFSLFEVAGAAEGDFLTVGYSVVGVPEPTIMLLLGAGLVCLAGIRRRFRG